MGWLISGGTAAAEPAVLYVPTEPVTLLPLNMPPCGSSVSSALGCGGVTEEQTLDPYADAELLTMALAAALVDYDVMVTNTRPPEYVPYVMLLASDEPVPESQSFTCTSAGINCGARQRNDIAFTRGPTINCMDPEVTHASLYAFGRLSGLEGVANPQDWMGYVPDFTTPPQGYLDVCSDRVSQLGFDDLGQQIELPLECTSLDHAACPDGTNGEPGQNSHQDLLLSYGARTEDTDPPVLSNVVPVDGAVLQQGADLVLDVDVADADPVVAVRWVVSSPALEAAGIEGGQLSQCTNDVCDVSWNDATPLKATDSDWSFELFGLPLGEYTITLEAADFHGNVATIVTSVVTIDEDGIGDTDDSTTGPVPPDPDTGDDGAFTTGEAEGEIGGEVEEEGDAGRPDPSEGDGSSGSSDGGFNLERPGCSCRTTRTPGGMVLVLLGCMGLGVLRRRRG
jgi:MYXO-CTERM domain-containing protein